MGTDDPGNDNRDSGLDLRILNYLRRHPFAGDDVEGISRFWLAGAGPRSHDDVRNALTRLVGRGVVERRSNRDGTTIYCASQALRERIHRDRQAGG